MKHGDREPFSLVEIEKAIKNGEVLDIFYMGGSAPGRRRQISPMKVLSSAKGLFEAYCYKAESVRHFLADRAYLARSNDGNVAYGLIKRYENSEEVLLKKQYSSIDGLSGLASHIDHKINEMGWVIETNTSTLFIHRRLKNGRVLVGSELSIEHTKYREYWIPDEETGLEKQVKKRSARPWTVRHKDNNGRAYANFDSACERFMENLESSISQYAK